MPSQAAYANQAISGTSAAKLSSGTQPIAPSQSAVANQTRPTSQQTTTPSSLSIGATSNPTDSRSDIAFAAQFQGASPAPNGTVGSTTRVNPNHPNPVTQSATTIPNTNGLSGQRPQRRTPNGLPGIGILSGRSISSILQTSTVTPETTEETDNEEEQTVEIDADVETALTEGLKRLTEEMMHERPRIGIFCQDAQVEGNLVRMIVPNESAYDELSNCLTALKSRLGELSDVHVPIQIQVNIKASTKGLKPIKVEDRLRYLTEKNPVLNRLRKELELDVE